MSEHQFLKTMIEAIKHDDDYEGKDKLLAILRNSIVTYNETNVFARKRGQYWEDIDLRVPIPMLKAAKELWPTLNNLASEVYMESSDYAFRKLNIRPKPVELEGDELAEHDVQFSEIKATIIQGIRSAKYTIWVAVAWFTDDDICEELILRKRAGVNVRIITSGEHSNRYLIGKLQQNFEVTTVSLCGKNLMHDKFCIIDFEFVMHGSYNWSRNATANDETLATALDRDFVRKFSDEFIRLYTENA